VEVLAKAHMKTKCQPGMKYLLIVTAVIEVGAGLSLLCCPSTMVKLLLASTLASLATRVLGRFAGAALLALGLANWLARREDQSLSTRGLVGAMLLYNLGAVLILTAYGCQSQTIGVALWPAVIVHAIMSAWCATTFIRKSVHSVSESQPEE
jgi:hypothetical protein